MLYSVLIDDEPHAVSEFEALIARVPGIANLASFWEVESAVDYLGRRDGVDVIFTDIDMPDIDGLEAAEMLRSFCDFLIYVTGHRKFALEAFSAMASGYLLKPVGLSDLIRQVSAIQDKKKSYLKHVADGFEDSIMMIKGDNKNTFIPTDLREVIAIKAMLNYVIIQATSGEEITYMGLKAIEAVLKPKPYFIRISRSAIISMYHVKKVEGNVVFMKNNTVFDVGEKYRNAFHAFLRDHLPRI